MSIVRKSIHTHYCNKIVKKIKMAAMVRQIELWIWYKLTVFALWFKMYMHVATNNV